jgi:hypothetical protein
MPGEVFEPDDNKDSEQSGQGSDEYKQDKTKLISVPVPPSMIERSAGIDGVRYEARLVPNESESEDEQVSGVGEVAVGASVEPHGTESSKVDIPVEKGNSSSGFEERFAEATAVQNTMIENLRSTGLDQSAVEGAVQKLEDKKQEIAEKIKSEIEAEKAAAQEADVKRLEEVKKIKNRVVERVTSIVVNGLDSKETAISYGILKFTAPKGSNEIFEDDDASGRTLDDAKQREYLEHPHLVEMKTDEVSEAVNFAYKLLGAQQPPVETFELSEGGGETDEGGFKKVHSYVFTAETESNIPGLYIIEDIWREPEKPVSAEEAKSLELTKLPLTRRKVTLLYKPQPKFAAEA